MVRHYRFNRAHFPLFNLLHLVASHMQIISQRNRLRPLGSQEEKIYIETKEFNIQWYFLFPHWNPCDMFST